MPYLLLQIKKVGKCKIQEAPRVYNSYLSSSTSNNLSFIYVFIRQFIFADSFNHFLIRFIFGEAKDLAEQSYYKETATI